MLPDSVVFGCIMKAQAALRKLHAVDGHYEERTLLHGYPDRARARSPPQSRAL